MKKWNNIQISEYINNIKRFIGKTNKNLNILLIRRKKLKNLKRVCIIILFFIIFNFYNVQADEYNYDGLNNVTISIESQVCIDTQTNGVSTDYKEAVVEISNMSLEIAENGYEKKYFDFIESSETEGCIKKYYTEVEPFSKNAKLTIKGQAYSDEINVNTEFEEVFSSEELLSFIKESKGKSGCSINITARELKNIITYDIVFKSDDGGNFQNEQNYIDYTNILPGEEFPELPILNANENYEFLGWYDETIDLPIEKFPSEVTSDFYVIAKWKQKDNVVKAVSNNDNINNNALELKKDAENLYSYNPPKTAFENNVVLLIVSYIMSLTVSLG